MNKDLINNLVKHEVEIIVQSQYAEEKAIESIVDAEMA